MSQRNLRDQIAAGQERLAAIREEHQISQRQARSSAMTQRKTDYGDRVCRPHDIAPINDALDALYESAAETLDEVTKANSRVQKIDQATSDRVNDRFPEIGGAR